MPRIGSYKVGATRALQKKAGPVRWLDFELVEPKGNLNHVSLYFYEDKLPPDPGIGFVNRTSGYVMVNLPLKDFEPMYHIVQTEKPAFVTWRTDPDPDVERIVSIDVSTLEEPLGEGIEDRTSKAHQIAR